MDKTARITVNHNDAVAIMPGRWRGFGPRDDMLVSQQAALRRNGNKNRSCQIMVIPGHTSASHSSALHSFYGLSVGSGAVTVRRIPGGAAGILLRSICGIGKSSAQSTALVSSL